MKNKNFTKTYLNSLNNLDLCAILNSLHIPYKKDAKKSELVEQILQYNQNGYTYQDTSSKGLPMQLGRAKTLPLDDMEIDKDSDTCLRSLVEGLFEPVDDNFGIVYIFSDNGFEPNVVILSTTLISQNLIRRGDHVMGFVDENDQYPLSLISVYRINGKLPTSLSARQTFEEKPTAQPNEAIRFSSSSSQPANKLLDFFFPIGKGSLCKVAGSREASTTNFLSNLANSARDNSSSLHIIYLTTKTPPTAKHKETQNSSIEYLTISPTATPKVQTHQIDTILCRAKRLSEEGHDVLVILDDLLGLYKIYKNHFKSEPLNPDEELIYSPITHTKDFLTTAKNFESDGSITIIFGFNKEPAEGINELSTALDDLPDVEIHLQKGDSLAEADIDILSSYSKNINSLLPALQSDASKLLRRLYLKGEVDRDLILRIIEERNYSLIPDVALTEDF